ncbi:hypothetical protein ABPG75_008652 [Micractinium tetrahymenae]
MLFTTLLNQPLSASCLLEHLDCLLACNVMHVQARGAIARILVVAATGAAPALPISATSTLLSGNILFPPVCVKPCLLVALNHCKQASEVQTLSKRTLRSSKVAHALGLLLWSSAQPCKQSAMRLRAKEAVPDHWRRAVRLSVAISLLGILGYSLVSRPPYQRGPLVLVVKWAMITLPVVTMPLLGKTSQVGAERILGTVAGGILGFLAAAVATNWWTLQANEADDLFLAAATGAAAFLAVLAGKRWNLDLSARLFVIAFIIVSFNAQQGKDPFMVAVTRICGIAAGVATMLLMSVLILPKSATIESLRTLRKALLKLREINSLVWGDYLPAVPLAAQQGAHAAAAGKLGGSSSSGAAQRGLSDSALQEPLLGPQDEGRDLEAGAAAAGGARQAPLLAAVVDGTTGVAARPAEEASDATLLKCEKALTGLYSLLDDLDEQLGLAKREVWVGSCGGHPFLLPGVPFWLANGSHLPWAELEAAANSVRRVARLLNTALFSFEDGFDQQLREVLGPLYPADLLPRLAAGADAAIQDLCAAFPFEPEAGSGGLAAFNASVDALTAISDQQRREVVRALRRYRTRSAARASWAHAIEAAMQRRPVLQQQHQHLGSPLGAPAQVQPAANTPEDRTAADAAAAASEPQAPGGRPVIAAREASLASWLHRPSSPRAGNVEADIAAAVSAVDGSAAGGPAGGAAEAGAVAGGSPGDVASSTDAATLGSGSIPAKVAAGCERPSLPAMLPAQATSDEEAAAGGSTAPGGNGNGKPPAAAQPVGVPRRSGSSDLLGGSYGSPPLLQPVLALREAGAGGIPPGLFPETTEGHLAQVAWYSFQFLCEELGEQLAGLHAAVNAVLRRLPE